jgi:hypothetical protein
MMMIYVPSLPPELVVHLFRRGFQEKVSLVDEGAGVQDAAWEQGLSGNKSSCTGHCLGAEAAAEEEFSYLVCNSTPKSTTLDPKLAVPASVAISFIVLQSCLNISLSSANNIFARF